MDNRDRIIRYVRHYHERSGGTSFPTVRQVARALRIRQAEVEAGCEDLSLMLTAYFTIPEQKLSEHFVEICE